MKFRINYEKVIQQSNHVQEVAQQVAQQVQQVQQLRQDCNSVWKGDAADAFLSKLSELQEKMVRSQRQAERLASTIRFCAQRIKREDEAAAQRAATLRTGR